MKSGSVIEAARFCATLSLSLLAMGLLSILGGLWVTLRMRSIDPVARSLGVIVGAIATGIAIRQGLHGQSAFASAKLPVPPLAPQRAARGTRILAQAGRFFLTAVVALVGVVAFYAAYVVLKDRDWAVVRSRLRVLVWYLVAVGASVHGAVLPGVPVRRHPLQLTIPVAYEIALASAALIALLVFVAVVLRFGAEARRRKAVVIGFWGRLGGRLGRQSVRPDGARGGHRASPAARGACDIRQARTGACGRRAALSTRLDVAESRSADGDSPRAQPMQCLRSMPASS